MEYLATIGCASYECERGWPKNISVNDIWIVSEIQRNERNGVMFIRSNRTHIDSMLQFHELSMYIYIRLNLGGDELCRNVRGIGIKLYIYIYEFPAGWLWLDGHMNTMIGETRSRMCKLSAYCFFLSNSRYMFPFFGILRYSGYLIKWYTSRSNI